MAENEEEKMSVVVQKETKRKPTEIKKERPHKHKHKHKDKHKDQSKHKKKQAHDHHHRHHKDKPPSSNHKKEQKEKHKQKKAQILQKITPPVHATAPSVPNKNIQNKKSHKEKRKRKTLYEKIENVPYIGGTLHYLKPVFGCCAGFYNKAFPEEDDIIEDESWSWSPEDTPEIFIYILLLAVLIFCLFNLIGQICVSILSSKVEHVVGHPIVMATAFPPLITLIIIFIFLVSKFRAIHILHFEIPLLLWTGSSVFIGVIASLADHSKLKMELKCLDAQRDIDEETCSNWFGAWRVCVAGLSGMAICLILIGGCSIWRRKTIIAVQHLNDNGTDSSEEETFRPPSILSEEEFEEGHQYEGDEEETSDYA